MIKFGTDGWRALMDTDFTMENVEKVAQAYADHLVETVAAPNKHAARVVVGYDFRKNSEDFAARFADVLAANGVEVALSDCACPTPAVSFTIVRGKYDGGVAVTASHNPPGYNGIKLKTDFGGSAEKNITDAVERRLGKNPVRRSPDGQPLPKTQNLIGPYLDFLKSYLKLDVLRAAPYGILVDSMHGVGAKNIEQILSGGKIGIETIRGERDVTYGGYAPEPIPKNLVPSIEKMNRHLLRGSNV